MLSDGAKNLLRCPVCGQCVSEFHRLKDDGLIYVDTPFMQQVHGGRYDFTRFTHLGHRRLLRRFEEIESGPVGGPAVALAWSYQYFLTSFSKRASVRRALRAFARLSGFWLRYCDPLLINKPGAFDSASGYYFISRKSDKVPERSGTDKTVPGCWVRPLCA